MAFVVFLSAAIMAGTPLLFATLGEILTEKSGNLNLGVEGLMLIGAVMGFLVGHYTQSPVLAMLAAAAGGAFGSLIFAILTVTMRANQVVAGLSITILGSGISGFVGQTLVGEVLPETFTRFFDPVKIPVLGDIPVLGTLFFQHNVYVYLGLFTAILMTLYLFRTKKGLNLRVVGENPYAADASGINVDLYKYIHILAGGALCGLGGAYLSLVYVPAWQENVTAGRGWIAVALVIFCSWNPIKAIFGSYLFGGLDIVGFRIQQMGIPVSQYLIDMLPYLVTILVLVYDSTRKTGAAKAPEALSEPYFREERH